MQTMTRNSNQTSATSFKFESEEALSTQESALLLGALLTLATVISSLWIL